MRNTTSTNDATGNRSLRVLIVEDHEDCLTMMSMLLEMLGHQVTPARSIQSAMQASDAAHFDCVISDLGLPDGSGLQLIRQLLEKRPVPAIALSGSVQDDDIQASLSAGFKRHLAKPVDVTELEAALHSLCA